MITMDIIIIIKNRTQSTKRQNKTEERTEQSTCTQNWCTCHAMNDMSPAVKALSIHY